MRSFFLAVAALAVLPTGRAVAEDCTAALPTRYSVTVDSRNDEWVGTGVNVDSGDLLFITATGTVKLSGSKKATPGQKTTLNGKVTYENGALELKIGTTYRTFADEKYAAEAPAVGEVKFRIKDSNYDDNQGTYLVQLVVVPARSIRTPSASSISTTPSTPASTSSSAAPSTSVSPAPTARIAVSDKQAFDESSLTPDIVLSKIQSAYMAGLRRCYAEHLKTDRNARGKVQLSLTVNEVGRTVSASTKGFAAAVDDCITAQMASWRFPVPKNSKAEPTHASFSISLQLVSDSP